MKLIATDAVDQEGSTSQRSLLASIHQRTNSQTTQGAQVSDFAQNLNQAKAEKFDTSQNLKGKNEPHKVEKAQKEETRQNEPEKLRTSEGSQN